MESAAGSDDDKKFQEFWNLFAGKKIGEGAARCVYELQNNKTHIIKVETEAGSFQNILEYTVWDRIQNTEFAKWFAPVTKLSPSGLILVQAKTEPIPKKLLPRKVPAFFTDMKTSNWGLLKGRPVCHDYGLTLLMERGMTKAMKKADWWTP